MAVDPLRWNCILLRRPKKILHNAFRQKPSWIQHLRHPLDCLHVYVPGRETSRWRAVVLLFWVQFKCHWSTVFSGHSCRITHVPSSSRSGGISCLKKNLQTPWHCQDIPARYALHPPFFLHEPQTVAPKWMPLPPSMHQIFHHWLPLNISPSNHIKSLLLSLYVL